MSISSEITRITGNIADAYEKVSGKGGTLPAARNSANLPAAIESIPSGGEPYDGTVEDYVFEETWVINLFPDFTTSTFQINFKSNGVNFDTIDFLYRTTGFKAEAINYVTELQSTLVYNGLSDGWTNRAYCTVTFLEPPTGDLLTWLQANAVKQ